MRIERGDCLVVLGTLEESSVDAVVTDPPYELGFMGKAWDASGIAYRVELWREVLRVLKPGGHLLAFGGTRTSHRMVCAIEDAGFEVRDSVLWLHGQGFPKSLDVSKAIDKGAGVERATLGPLQSVADHNLPGTGAQFRNIAEKGGARKLVPTATVPATPLAEKWQGFGTALKPAHEPVCMARKPLAGTVAANVAKHGTGALNIDGCRIDVPPDDTNHFGPSVAFGKGKTRVYGDGLGGRPTPNLSASGRFPANVILDPDAAAELDAQSGDRPSGAVLPYERATRNFNAFGRPPPKSTSIHEASTGGASRFFYVAKPSRRERGEGNVHPTVKPIALMRYLVRLVTPPGGLVLDPFAGSGTTGIAAKLEGFRFLGVEQDAAYAAIARRRIAGAKPEPEKKPKAKPAPRRFYTTQTGFPWASVG